MKTEDIKIEKNVPFQPISTMTKTDLVRRMKTGDSVLITKDLLSTLRSLIYTEGFSTQTRKEKGMIRLWKGGKR